MDGCVDQLRAVVVRSKLKAAGDHMFRVDLRDALLDAADDLFRVAATRHQHYAAYSLGVAVLDHRAVAYVRADLNVRNISNVDRSATGLLQHDVADVVKITHKSDGARDGEVVVVKLLGVDAG